jgi:hypothetical protein
MCVARMAASQEVACSILSGSGTSAISILGTLQVRYIVLLQYPQRIRNLSNLPAVDIIYCSTCLAVSSADQEPQQSSIMTWKLCLASLACSILSGSGTSAIEGLSQGGEVSQKAKGTLGPFPAFSTARSLIVSYLFPLRNAHFFANRFLHRYKAGLRSYFLSRCAWRGFECGQILSSLF